MTGLPVYSTYPELTLVATSMHTHAWGIYNLGPLLLGCPILRNAEDPVIPGRDGRIGLDDELDETTYSVPMWLTGECDPDGVEFSNTLVGLRRNRDELRSNVPQGEIITATIALHDEDDTTIEDLVKVQFEFVDLESEVVPFMLHVTVPGGWFGDALTGGS